MGRMTTWNRFKWDESSQGVFKFKHKFKVHFGEASFGACHSAGRSGRGASGSNNQPSAASEESVQSQRGTSPAGDLNRCGHAFIMQDPLTLAIADLAECFLSPRRNALCQLLHEGKTTVEEWVAARGSVVFKNILFHSELCRNMTHHNVPKPHLHNSDVQSPQELCEAAHAAFVNNLDPHAVDSLTSFMIDNLQNWFSVVGIFEDFINSLTMLNHVFRFPLHECDFLSSFRSPLSYKTPRDDTTTKHNGVKNNSAKHSPPPWFERSQYENIASLSKLTDDSSGTVSWFHALGRIENSLPWRKTLRIQTPSSLNDNYQTSSPPLDDSSLHDGVQNKLDQINYSFTNSGLNQNTLTLRPDKNPTTVSPVPDKSSQIKNSLQRRELYLDDLTSNNGSAPPDGTEGDGDEEAGRSMNDVVLEQTVSWRAKTLPADAAMGRLYKRFMKSLTIRQSLAADLRIYEVVKRLYTAQKQLFFNSIKLT